MREEEQKILFQDLISQHKGILYKVAKMYCPDEEERQDLIQEILIQIWQSLPRYNDKFRITTWLYRISLNVAISYYRKKSARGANRIALDERVSQIPQTDRTEDERQLSLLEKFISELKEIDRALMILYLEDKTHADIAEILGISVSNVGTRVVRIKDRLKQRFSQYNL